MSGSGWHTQLRGAPSSLGTGKCGPWGTAELDLKEFTDLHARAKREKAKVVLFNSTSRINSNPS